MASLGSLIIYQTFFLHLVPCRIKTNCHTYWILILWTTLFVTKSDIICIPCKLRVCKFPKNSMDENYMHPEISENFRCLILNLRTRTIVIPTIFWKFSKLRLTSPLGPIRYSILRIRATHEANTTLLDILVDNSV